MILYVNWLRFVCDISLTGHSLQFDHDKFGEREMNEFFESEIFYEKYFRHFFASSYISC